MKSIKMIVGICIVTLLVSMFAFGAMAQDKGLIVFAAPWTEDPFWVSATDAAKVIV